MKKIIALKDSLLCKRGEVFELFDGYAINFVSIKGRQWDEGTIHQWISEGWFAWKEEEKTLSDEISNLLLNTEYRPNTYIFIKEIADVAREKALTILEKAEDCYTDKDEDDQVIFNYIKESLKQGMV